MYADRIPLTRPVPTRADRLNDARGCDALCRDVEVERDQLRAELGRALDALATIRDGQERIDRALAAYDTTPGSTTTPALGSPADRAQDAWDALDEAMQPVLAQANPGQEPSTPGQDVALIERAAAVIAAAQKQPHTAPYHWAGALFDAGLLAGSPADRAQEPEREEVRWAYRWIGPDGQVYDEMDASDNAIETAEQRAHRIAARHLTGTVRSEVIRYRVLTMPAEVVTTYPFEEPA